MRNDPIENRKVVGESEGAMNVAFEVADRFESIYREH